MGGKKGYGNTNMSIIICRGLWENRKRAFFANTVSYLVIRLSCVLPRCCHVFSYSHTKQKLSQFMMLAYFLTASHLFHPYWQSFSLWTNKLCWSVHRIWRVEFHVTHITQSHMTVVINSSLNSCLVPQTEKWCVHLLFAILIHTCELYPNRGQYEERRYITALCFILMNI